MLFKVLLTFESVDEILVCDHSNESYRGLLPSGDVFILLNTVSLKFGSVDKLKLTSLTIQMKEN